MITPELSGSFDTAAFVARVKYSLASIRRCSSAGLGKLTTRSRIPETNEFSVPRCLFTTRSSEKLVVKLTHPFRRVVYDGSVKVFKVSVFHKNQALSSCSSWQH